MIKVLVADDQEMIRESLKIVLNSKEDFEVTDAVANGLEVIQSIRKNKPDVILMDIRMPKVHGVQCTQMVKEGYPDIKIIILTTFDDDEYVYNALRFGASGYLLKGVSMEGLQEAIRAAHQGQSMINPDVATKVLKFFSDMAKDESLIKIEDFQVKDITTGEWKIIDEVAKGKSNKEISETLALSEGTVRNYLSVILEKLSLRDRTQLAIWAIQSHRSH